MELGQSEDLLFGPKLVEAYRRYWSDYSLGIVGAFWKLARKHGIVPRSLADLACGDGTFLTRASEQIDRAYGVDQSAAMLDAARDRERERRELLQRTGRALNSRITWIEADMREFQLPEKVDVVTSWYNSVNYMQTGDDAATVFRRVYDALVPRGHFLFDVYTPAGMADEWQDSAWVAVDAEDCFVSSRTTYHPPSGLGQVHFTGFLRGDDGRYERFDEVHENRSYPLDELREMLDGGGFEVRDCVSVPRLNEPTEDDGRVAFVCRRMEQ